MTDFILDNTDAPPYRKENPSLFRPPSASQTLRQAIYARLMATPEECVTLKTLSAVLLAESSQVYRACRQLVKHGFATREIVKEPKARQKDPSVTTDRIAVKFVQPWEGKKESKW